MSDTPEPKPHRAARTTTYVASRPTIRLAMPDGWGRSVLAGLETVFIGWVLVTLASVAAYFSVSANPWVGSSNWEGAFSLGADVWALVLGAPLHVGDVAYTAPPTLFGLILIVVLKLLLRTSKRFPASAQWFAIPAFTIASFSVVGAGASYTHWWECWPGALAIPLIATAWQVLQQVSASLDRLSLPKWSQRGLKLGLLEVGIVLGVGAIALLTALITHFEKISSIHSLLLTTSVFDATLVVGAQVLYTPTLIAWTLAWLAGPGVYIGVDALHSPSSAPTKPIPGFPVLGALPEEAPGIWVIVILIGVGLAAGVLFGQRFRREDLVTQVKENLVALAVLTIITLTWMMTAQMHLGAQRMALVGPNAITAALALSAEVGLPALLMSTLVHPKTIAWMTSQWAQSTTPVARTNAAPAPAPAPEDKRSEDENEDATDAPDAPAPLIAVDRLATNTSDDEDITMPTGLDEILEVEPSVPHRQHDLTEGDTTVPAGIDSDADRARGAVPWTPTPVVVEAAVTSPAEQERIERLRAQGLVDDEYDLETNPSTS